ncbi:MAG: oligosaccharide flippase family protein [Actinomycetota bacterium]
MPAARLALADRWARLRASPEGRRSAWSGIGLIVSSALVAVVVFVAARDLGTAEYGVYAGIGALVNLAAVFGALGAKDVLLKRGTADAAALPAAWGVLLVANVVVAVPLLTLTVGVAALLLPGRDLVAIIALAVAEYVSAGLVKGPGNIWVALDRFGMVAFVNILDAALRVVAVIILVLGTPEVRTLALALAVCIGIGAMIVNALAWRAIGRPTFRRTELDTSLRQGAGFSITTVSNTVQTNIDQFMLLRARLDVDAGLYAAGARLIQYSMLPLHALTAGAVREFFRLGNDGLEQSLAYARSLRRTFAVLSLGGALFAVAISPIAGAVLGDEFDGVVPVVLALAGYPLLRSAQTLVSQPLLGSGHQSEVARIQVSTAILNVAINLPLIAAFGLWGAVIATYVSELATLALLIRTARRSTTS